MRFSGRRKQEKHGVLEPSSPCLFACISLSTSILACLSAPIYVLKRKAKLLSREADIPLNQALIAFYESHDNPDKQWSAELCVPEEVFQNEILPLMQSQRVKSLEIALSLIGVYKHENSMKPDFYLRPKIAATGFIDVFRMREREYKFSEAPPKKKPFFSKDKNLLIIILLFLAYIAIRLS